jgi:hypothetical protein
VTKKVVGVFVRFSLSASAATKKIAIKWLQGRQYRAGLADHHVGQFQRSRQRSLIRTAITGVVNHCDGWAGSHDHHALKDLTEQH